MLCTLYWNSFQSIEHVHYGKWIDKFKSKKPQQNGKEKKNFIYNFLCKAICTTIKSQRLTKKINKKKNNNDK